MARITASRKQLKPDPKFGSLLAAKFINCLMWEGKKSVVQNVFYDALDIIKERVSIRRTGARWALESMANMQEEGTREPEGG